MLRLCLGIGVERLFHVARTFALILGPWTLNLVLLFMMNHPQLHYRSSSDSIVCGIASDSMRSDAQGTIRVQAYVEFRYRRRQVSHDDLNGPWIPVTSGLATPGTYWIRRPRRTKKIRG